MTIAICGPSGKRVYAGPATAYALIARPTVRSRSPQCDPIAKQTNLQVISRIVSDDMMLEAGPVATGGNEDPTMQPADMPMVADQTSPPRKQLRHDEGGSGPYLSAIHTRREAPLPSLMKLWQKKPRLKETRDVQPGISHKLPNCSKKFLSCKTHTKIPVITL